MLAVGSRSKSSSRSSRQTNATANLPHCHAPKAMLPASLGPGRGQQRARQQHATQSSKRLCHLCSAGAGGARVPWHASGIQAWGQQMQTAAQDSWRSAPPARPARQLTMPLRPIKQAKACSSRSGQCAPRPCRCRSPTQSRCSRGCTTPAGRRPAARTRGPWRLATPALWPWKSPPGSGRCTAPPMLPAARQRKRGRLVAGEGWQQRGRRRQDGRGWGHIARSQPTWLTALKQ